jgi:hypothetical protein
MSLAAFQRAFADLAAAPALVERVRASGAPALAAYDLTDREAARLVAAARQKGMDAQCSMYRITRLTALNSLLPLTLRALRPALSPLLDSYWAAEPVHEVRFAEEARRFLAHLESHPDTLAKAAGPAAAQVRDLAALELAVEEIRLETPADGEDPVAATLALSHDPQSLLEAAPHGLDALARVPATPTTLLIAATPGQAPQLLRLEPA